MFELKGFDRLMKKFEKLSENAKDLDGSQKLVSIQTRDLFPDEFLQKHTKFTSFDDFNEKTNNEDLENPEYIQANTEFANFEEMKECAFRETGVLDKEIEEMKNKLFDGI